MDGPQILRHLKHSDTIQYTFYGFKRLGGGKWCLESDQNILLKYISQDDCVLHTMKAEQVTCTEGL